MPTGATAILIFSRTAREEGASRRYAASVRTGSAIARQLIRHTRAAAFRTGLPVIRIDSNLQRGRGFGERFANAIEDVFRLGYSRVVALGTDTPGITAAAIRSIAEHPEPDGLVAGPAPDGGVWALRISKAAWNRELFTGIAWQTPAVQDELARYAFALGAKFSAVASLADLDDAAAVACWVRNARGAHPLARAIAAMLVRPTAYVAAGRVYLQEPMRAVCPLRGPPSCR